MMEILQEIARWLSWACLAGGALVVITTGVALLRLPSYYARVHGAGISDSLGAGLILTGLILQVLPPHHLAGDLLLAAKLALVLAFLVLTGPTAAHALAKAAYLHGLEPEPEKEPPAEATDGWKGERPSPP
jgi:multicomponent Na+:H+ antiporter subunit G